MKLGIVGLPNVGKSTLFNSLTKAAYYDGLQAFPAEHLVRIMNPLSSDLNVMRQTMLFGGLESIAYNVNRRNPNLRFFEFGNCYQFDPEKQNTEDPMRAYKEEYHLALWLTGKRVVHRESDLRLRGKRRVIRNGDFISIVIRYDVSSFCTLFLVRSQRSSAECSCSNCQSGCSE